MKLLEAKRLDPFLIGTLLLAGEAVVVIDADLQDPPELILEMIAKCKEGYQVVYAKRTGETKYPLKKMIKLSLDRLTSFSVKPLQMANYAGVILISFGFSYLMAMIFFKILTASVIAGWKLVISLQFK